MSARVSSRIALAALLAVSATLSACRGREERREAERSAPPATLPAPAAPGTTPAVALRVVDVDLGRSVGPDQRVITETDEFTRNDTIYAVVETEGMADNAALTSRWTFEDGQTVDESSQTISPKGAAITTFHVVKPSGWPKGKYKVAILLNGTQVDDEEFEVKR